MAKMTLLWCLVRIQGDMNQVTPPSDRGFGPCVVSWPEAQVLATIHNAEDCLEQVRVVGTADTTPRAEKARLHSLYGSVVEQLFPGVAPRMDLEAPADLSLSTSEPEAPLTDAGPVAVPSFVITDPALLADANTTAEFPADFFEGEEDPAQGPGEPDAEAPTEVPSPRGTRTRRAG